MSAIIIFYVFTQTKTKTKKARNLPRACLAKLERLAGEPRAKNSKKNTPDKGIAWGATSFVPVTLDRAVANLINDQVELVLC